MAGKDTAKTLEKLARWRRLRWVITALVSVALAVVPPLIDPDAVTIQLGLLIGLAGISCGFLIEQHLRSEELGRLVLESAEQGARDGAHRTESALVRLTPVALAPEPCRKLVERIALDWQRVDHHGDIPFFREIRSSLADEFTARIAELANGAITVAVDSPYTFRESSLRGVRAHRLVTVGSLDFWTEEVGVNYLAVQQEAIRDRGAKIERTFVIEEDDLRDASLVLAAQLQAGVHVSIVIRERVKPEHHVYLVDRGLAYYDNGIRLLVELNSTHGGRADRERQSTIPADLETAETGLLVMKRYSRSVESLYDRDDSDGTLYLRVRR